jgi:hypothetical protein
VHQLGPGLLAGPGQDLGADGVGLVGLVGALLGAVHVGEGSGVEDDVRVALAQERPHPLAVVMLHSSRP